MMRITGVNKKFDITVDLVGSKSASNRALMIAYYGGFTPRIKNLSESDDTKLLFKILKSLPVKTRFIASQQSISDGIIIDCHNAGTVLRFLATALAFPVETFPETSHEYILTGSDRMLQRPIGDLVDALRSMGADIEYMGQEGFPPLKIRGKSPVETFPETSQPIHVDITHSSQFASSILLALPIVETGRCPSPNVNETDSGPSLHLDGDLSSLPYIDMTIDIMQKFGAKIHREGRDIFIQPSDYQDIEYTVESDWTCASYWYEIVAFSENGRARLRNLHLDSKQGDAIVAKWFEQFGVKSVQDGNDVVITKSVETFPETSQNNHEKPLHLDFINNPDLYPTIAATCAGLGIKGDFTGLQNLKFKESDRVAAMTTELSHVGTRRATSLQMDSHNDHRIAMALAPLAMKIGAIEIDNADVVSKSYPNFWEELEKLLPSAR